jgi:hypothetical protein
MTKRVRFSVGLPRTLVLYRADEGWRYTLSMDRGVVDGALKGAPAEAPLFEAQTAARDFVERWVGGRCVLSWRDGDIPQVWTGDVVEFVPAVPT